MPGVQADHQHVVPSILCRGGGVRLEQAPVLGGRSLPAIRLLPALRRAHKDHQLPVSRLGIRQQGRPVRPGRRPEPVAPGPGLPLEGGPPARGQAGQAHALLTAGILQGDAQPVQAVRPGGPSALRPENHIAADAQAVGVVPQHRRIRRPLAVPAEHTGGLAGRGKGVARHAVRGNHLKPQAQRPLPQPGESDPQRGGGLTRPAEGAEGNRASAQQLPHVGRPILPGHADPGQRRPPGGHALGQLKGDPLPGDQPGKGEPGGAVRLQLHRTGRRRRRPGGYPRQLEQLPFQPVGELIHLVLLELFVPGHQLQNRDAWVVGVVVCPGRTQPRKPALRCLHNLLIGLVVQIPGLEHGAVPPFLWCSFYSAWIK